MFESRGICRRWAFNRKFCRWILHSTKQLSVLSNLTRGKGLVITILTCNLTSTPQGLDIAKDAFITFCFTRVSCDIQIRQLINDIKCALADFVPLSRSATVINIRILLKATSYFSPSLHYVWIFTSRTFLNKKKLSGLLSSSLSELEITITTIPIDPFVVILSQILYRN